jgi:hypothetical protein
MGLFSGLFSGSIPKHGTKLAALRVACSPYACSMLFALLGALLFLIFSISPQHRHAQSADLALRKTTTTKRKVSRLGMF